MTTLTVKYNRKNFFGEREYTEDVRRNPSLKDFQKAFRFLKSDYNAAIQIDNTVLFWDSMQNFEYATLDCRVYDGYGNYKESIWDFDGCKNYYYKICKEAAGNNYF